MQPPDWLVEIFKQSPTLAVCLVVVWYAVKYIREEQAKHLKSKDDEIKRLVQEKNSLQEIILIKRLSTEDGKNPKGGEKK